MWAHTKYRFVKDLPAVIDGASFRYENYHGEYERYWIKCTHHLDCQKSRNCGVEQTRVFGKWEPIAYLLCWNDVGVLADTADEHINARFRPRDAELRVWLEANGKL